MDWNSIGSERIRRWIADPKPANWQAPVEFPSTLGPCWEFAVELGVVDFEAEIGFFMDGIGLDALVLDADYALLMTPDKKNHFGLVRVPEVGSGRSIAVEFMVADLDGLFATLSGRGIEFPEPPTEHYGGSLRRATASSPSGLPVRFWAVPAD